MFSYHYSRYDIALALKIEKNKKLEKRKQRLTISICKPE